MPSGRIIGAIGPSIGALPLKVDEPGGKGVFGSF